MRRVKFPITVEGRVETVRDNTIVVLLPKKIMRDVLWPTSLAFEIGSWFNHNDSTMVFLGECGGWRWRQRMWRFSLPRSEVSSLCGCPPVKGDDVTFIFNSASLPNFFQPDGDPANSSGSKTKKVDE